MAQSGAGPFVLGLVEEDGWQTGGPVSIGGLSKLGNGIY